MPIWGEVELFCRAILDEGRKEADNILTRAKAEAERVITGAQERAEKELQEKIVAQRSEAYMGAKRLVDSTELEAKKRIIAFREQLIQEIFRALELRLRKISDQPEYPDFLLSTIREGIRSLPGKEFVIELKQEDLELVKEKTEALGRELSAKIELRTLPSIEGGSRIYTADRRLLYDNSLLARLKRREDEIRQQIWKKIFGTETNRT